MLRQFGLPHAILQRSRAELSGFTTSAVLEALARDMKFKVTHVPYKGIAPAMQDVLAGQVGIIILDGTTAKPHVVGGKLRPIAVLSSKRIPYMAQVQTAAEQGMPNFSVEVLSGLVAPPGTPAEWRWCRSPARPSSGTRRSRS